MKRMQIFILVTMPEGIVAMENEMKHSRGLCECKLYVASCKLSPSANFHLVSLSLY